MQRKKLGPFTRPNIKLKGKDLETLCSDQKCEEFKIAERMVKTYQDIPGAQCIKNDNGVMIVSDEYEKIALKGYHEKLLNTKFAGDRNSLSQADPVSGVTRVTDKEMVRELISKIKNGKTAGPSV